MDPLSTFSDSREFEANVLNMYHNSLSAMHQGPYRTFLTMRKQFYFPNMLPKYKSILKRVPYAKEQSLKTQNNDHTTAAYQPNIFHAKI